MRPRGVTGCDFRAAPDVPIQSEVPAPPQLLADRDHAYAHRLWWNPGAHGKGILFDCGLVHTWPEGEGDHQHYIDRHYRRAGCRPRMLFHVRPNGEVRLPDDRAEDAAELTATLMTADSRLRPSVPRARTAERPAAPSPRDREQWLLLQRRARSRAG